MHAIVDDTYTVHGACPHECRTPARRITPAKTVARLRCGVRQTIPTPAGAVREAQRLR